MNKRPLYEEIKETLIARLASDHWRPGELLPSELKLAETFEVSQGTVRRALDELVSSRAPGASPGAGHSGHETYPFWLFSFISG
ncbi:GntR family transcriptional regulator [Arenicellales bacterium nBUS_45]